MKRIYFFIIFYFCIQKKVMYYRCSQDALQIEVSDILGNNHFPVEKINVNVIEYTYYKMDKRFLYHTSK